LPIKAVFLSFLPKMGYMYTQTKSLKNIRIRNEKQRQSVSKTERKKNICREETKKKHSARKKNNDNNIIGTKTRKRKQHQSMWIIKFLISAIK
jgi:hypothetical protein